MNIRKWLDYILPALFLLCFIIALIGTSLARPRVLVIMSYSDQDLWEQQIRAGLDKTFQTEAPYFMVSYSYLNVRDHNTADYITRVTENTEDLIASWHPQVLLLVDDDAQIYIGKKYLNKPKINLVFSGVSADPAVYGYKSKQNVTGITENLPFAAMQEAIKAIFPDYHKIIHVSDDSTISHIISPQIAAYNWNPLQFLGSYPAHSLDQWLSVIKKANAEHALLLVTHLHTVFDNGHLVGPQKIMQLTLQQAHVPVIGFFNFDVEWGAPMAVSNSGFEQGQTAAKMAINILSDNKNPGDIPFASSQYFHFALNPEGVAINIPNVKIPLTYRSLAYLFSYSKDNPENN